MEKLQISEHKMKLSNCELLESAAFLIKSGCNYGKVIGVHRNQKIVGSIGRGLDGLVVPTYSMVVFIGNQSENGNNLILWLK